VETAQVPSRISIGSTRGAMPRPFRIRARVLLTSVFDPPGASRRSNIIPQVLSGETPEKDPVPSEDPGVDAAEPAARF
jgi:hypothetical protein